MSVGDRIKRARNFRGMTQKELGIAVGFDEKSADIRIAQYESNTRTPKEDLLRKLAEALDVNYRSLYEPTLYAAEDIMYTLFELDEHYPGTKLYEVTDPDSSSSHMAVSFNYRLLDEFMREWQQRKKELQAGQITKEEYQEWKLNWPQRTQKCPLKNLPFSRGHSHVPMFGVIPISINSVSRRRIAFKISRRYQVFQGSLITPSQSLPAVCRCSHRTRG